MATVSIFAPEETEQWLKLLLWEQKSTVQLDAPLIATSSAVESIGRVERLDKEIHGLVAYLKYLSNRKLQWNVIVARLGVESPENFTPADVPLLRKLAHGNDGEVDCLGIAFQRKRLLVDEAKYRLGDFFVNHNRGRSELPLAKSKLRIRRSGRDESISKSNNPKSFDWVKVRVEDCKVAHAALDA